MISCAVLVLLILSAAILSFYDKPIAAIVWDKLFPIVGVALGGLTGWALCQPRKG